MTSLREAMQGTATHADLGIVDVPAWEQKVYVRQLTVREMSKLDNDNSDPVGTTLRIALHCIVDENGDRLLGDDDLELLMDQPWSIIMPLLGEVATRNGLTSDEVQAAIASFGQAPGQDSPTE